VFLLGVVVLAEAQTLLSPHIDAQDSMAQAHETNGCLAVNHFPGTGAWQDYTILEVACVRINPAFLLAGLPSGCH
jgi:uncharacterized membrane protein